MKVDIRSAAFDPWVEVSRYQREAFGDAAGAGAAAIFVGSVRDFNQGDTVQALYLEHYPEMTQKHLRQIAEQALARWPILDTLIIHRVGDLAPSDTIVVCAVWSAHRAAAFEACRFLIEDLKAREPFWKKEQTATGERWVEKNTPG